MMKMIKLFFSLLFITGMSSDFVFASSCPNGCGTHQYCSTKNPEPECRNCNNNPAGATPIASGNDNAPYSCQWELTCNNGKVFVPDPDHNSGECQPCQANYESSLGSTASYYVRWNGTGYEYSTDNSQWSTTNPANCVGKWYRINFNKNYSQINVTLPDSIWKQYGKSKWYESEKGDSCADMGSCKVSALQSWFMKFTGYYTEPSDGIQVFDENGDYVVSEPDDLTLFNDGNTQPNGDGNLYAHWSNWSTDDNCKYKLIIQYDNDGFDPQLLYTNDNCICGQNCVLDSCQTNGLYFVNPSISTNKGSLSFDNGTMTFTPSITEIPDNYTITITLTTDVSWCDAGNYCTGCIKTECPYDATSDKHAKSVTDCYFDSNTHITDKSERSFAPESGEKWYLFNTNN